MLRYNPKLKDPARALRTHLTDSEQILWSRLRRKQILGAQFYRQKPLDNYVVDFYAPSAQLIIEVDGSQHFAVAQAAYDQERTEYLESQGLRVLRFTNLEASRETEAVVEKIYGIVQKMEKSSPHKEKKKSPLIKGTARSARGFLVTESGRL